MIFVFGSNEAGLHGAGAAAVAVSEHGAWPGIGFGRRGSSFAIPTKDWDVQTLPLPAIQHYVHRFIAYAMHNSEIAFQVTALGTGLAGYQHYDIAPMFDDAPSNCWFDTEWRPYLRAPKHERYFWGTYATRHTNISRR